MEALEDYLKCYHNLAFNVFHFKQIYCFNIGFKDCDELFKTFLGALNFMKLL